MRKNMNMRNKYIVYGITILALSAMGVEALADTVVVADSAAQLVPLYNKILGSLSGTLGKVIMGVGILLSGVAALAGMNKAVIFTPLGTGIFLGNAQTLINWIFG